MWRGAHAPNVGGMKPRPEGESVHVAFLRNVMVGRAGLTQAVLVGAFRDCGASFAESFLATGNIIFESGAAPPSGVAECAALRLQEGFGLSEPFFVRSLRMGARC
jgi:uncharacterized protein (DUF1697 family)